jgi:bifunctional DNA-binding transcriptional regulator/antitoxin component of YhaV-PrlF toxin-antitoxin module
VGASTGVVEFAQIYNIRGGDSVARWQDVANAGKQAPTRVSRNGQVVLAAKARRAAGIEPGDLVVSVPVGPGVVRIEKVSGPPGRSWSEFLKSDENPLRGAFGPDPDAFVARLRGAWQDRTGS